jgi:pimeloyl-ACP methyl ester carboxylesterase
LGAYDKPCLYDINHNVRASENMQYDVYGTNYYFTHDEADNIEKLVDKLNEQAIKPNLIGHSLGGGTVTQVALAKAGKINNLVTVDPVGPIRLGKDPVTKVRVYGKPDYKKVKNSVNVWININAEVRPGHDSQGDNVVASLGGKWKYEPEDEADVFVRAPLDHAEFDAMLRAAAQNGVSARDILNKR